MLRFLGAHPEHSLLVAAHGAEEGVTTAQAKSVLAALAGDAAAWSEDWEKIAAWTAGPSGRPAAGDWAAVLASYDGELTRLLGVDRAELAARRAALRLVERSSIGCGAGWPITPGGRSRTPTTT